MVLLNILLILKWRIWEAAQEFLRQIHMEKSAQNQTEETGG